MTARGLHPVFRIPRNSAAAFDRFRDGDRDDAVSRVADSVLAVRRARRGG